MKIKVTYPGFLNTEVDEKIQTAMESIGAVWYVQGTDLTTGIRDICFDWENDQTKKL